MMLLRCYDNWVRFSFLGNPRFLSRSSITRSCCEIMDGSNGRKSFWDGVVMIYVSLIFSIFFYLHSVIGKRLWLQPRLGAWDWKRPAAAMGQVKDE
jgi:hypothetical protein